MLQLQRCWSLAKTSGFRVRTVLRKTQLESLAYCRLNYASLSHATPLRKAVDVEHVENPDGTCSHANQAQTATSWHAALTCPSYSSKEAYRDSSRSFSYQDVASAAYANHLKLEEDFKVEKTIKSKSKTLHGKRIAIYTPHDVSFVISLWSTWLSGGIAVPLGIKHPEPQLEYFLKNSDTSVIFCSEETRPSAERIAKACGAEILPIKPIFPVSSPEELRRAITPLTPPEDDAALILYTSGTTGQPKGVLWKHKALTGQVASMTESWRWSSEDTLLHVLPLYHLHGLVNGLITPLSCGAAVWMEPEFKPETVWRHLLSTQQNRVNVFTAVPTIYVKLLEYYKAHRNKLPSESEVKRICLSKMRLMISGSAPLPDSVFRAWENLTGHKLLERYGMTETGMILTNPLNGPRLPGTVGQPFPNVVTRIVPVKEKENAVPKEGDKPTEKPTFLENLKKHAGKSKESKEDKEAKNEDHIKHVTTERLDEPVVGELQVSGPNIFSGYWNNEKATRESFSDDGWFRTGDTAELRNGVYRLLGRTSTEIIKSGGYKLSALDIERRLTEHPSVAECVVFGVPDAVWGEKVVSYILLNDKPSEEFLSNDAERIHKAVTEWITQMLPAYHAPREIRIVREITRNQMGKVNKKELVKEYQASTTAAKDQSTTPGAKDASPKAS